MGSLKRKMERKKLLKKSKKAKKKLKQALNATLGMPTKCSGCDADFDPHNDADTWMVSAYDDMINLFCPTCYNKIQ